MKYCILILHILLVGITSSNAQSNKEKAFKSQFVFKLDPSKLLAPDRNASMSFEYRMSKKIGLQLETAYIFKPMWFMYDKNEKTLKYGGYKLVPEIKYYKPSTKPRHANRDRYYSFQVKIKNLDREFKGVGNIDSAGVLVIGPKLFTRNKLIIAPHFLYGVHYYFGANKKTSMEINIGIGLHRRVVTNSGTAIYRFETYRIDDSRSIILPSLTSNIRFCYHLF